MSYTLTYAGERFQLTGERVTSLNGYTIELPRSYTKYSLVRHAGKVVCVGDYYHEFDGVAFVKGQQLPFHTGCVAIGDLMVLFYVNKVYFFDYHVQQIKYLKFSPDCIKDVYAIYKYPLQLLCLISQRVVDGHAQQAELATNEAYLAYVFYNYDVRYARDVARMLHQTAGAKLLFEQYVEAYKASFEAVNTNIMQLRESVESAEEAFGTTLLVGVREQLGTLRSRFEEYFARLQRLYDDELLLLRVRKQSLAKRIRK